MLHLEALPFHQQKDLQKLFSTQKLEQAFVCF